MVNGIPKGTKSYIVAKTRELKEEERDSEYFGKLKEREIHFLVTLLEEKVKNQKIDFSRGGLDKLIKKLKEDFLIPEEINKPTLKNKFVETITFQH
jgi:hypothetical protein